MTANKLDEHVVAYQGNSLYDFDNKILLNWYPKRIINATSPTSTSILELGLGHGYSAKLFSKHFSKHLIIDGSPAVIKEFKQVYPDCTATIVESYFERFDTDQKFDVIVMGFILEHIDDPVFILNKFKNLLTDNGQLFIAVPNAESLNRRVGHEAGLLNDMTHLSEYDQMLGHKRYYTVESLSLDINKAGLELKNIEGIYLKPLTTEQMVSLELTEELIESFCKIGIQYPELSCGILAEVGFQSAL